MENVSDQSVIRSALRMSRVMLIAWVGVAGLASIGVVWLLAAPHALGELLGLVGGSDTTRLPTGQLAILLLIGLVNLAGWAVVLWWSHAMFAALAKGTPRNAVRFARWIAIGLWALFVWQVVAPALGSVVATWHLPPGQRSISIGFGLRHAGMLLSALVASSMAKALQFGAELWHDSKEII